MEELNRNWLPIAAGKLPLYDELRRSSICGAGTSGCRLQLLKWQTEEAFYLLPNIEIVPNDLDCW